MSCTYLIDVHLLYDRWLELCWIYNSANKVQLTSASIGIPQTKGHLLYYSFNMFRIGHKTTANYMRLMSDIPACHGKYHFNIVSLRIGSSQTPFRQASWTSDRDPTELLDAENWCKTPSFWASFFWTTGFATCNWQAKIGKFVPQMQIRWLQVTSITRIIEV